MLAAVDRFKDGLDKTINNVMENYFNRKNIKPLTYLQQPKLLPLQNIWVKFHHVSLPSQQASQNIIQSHNPQ